MELSEATKLVNNFLDNPSKTQPRILNKAAGVWSRAYGHYVMSINANTPKRIQMNIERLISMNTKCYGIIQILEGKESIAGEQIPYANGDTLINAYTIAQATTKMIAHLLSVSSPFQKPKTLVRNEMKIIEKTIHAKMCKEVQDQLDDAVVETVNLIKDARFHLRDKAVEKLEELKLSFGSFEIKCKNLEKLLETPQEIDDLYRLRNKLSSCCKDLVSTYKEMHFRMNLTDPDLQNLFSSYSVFITESTRDLHEEKLKLIVESIKLFKKMTNLVIDKINSQEENNDSDCQTNG